MSRNEWRISPTAIETEMQRLASLLADPTRPAEHTSRPRHEAHTANPPRKDAELSFAGGV